jgi:hypothetical protein
MNEILLRGCTLKNSGFVVGLVVYTGPESRIQMNAAEPPRKQGGWISASYFCMRPTQIGADSRLCWLCSASQTLQMRWAGLRLLTTLRRPHLCASADVGGVVLLRRVVHAVPEPAGHPHHHAADAAVRRLRGGSPGVAGGARWVQSLV